jgi:phosphopantetheinyl transferase
VGEKAAGTRADDEDSMAVLAGAAAGRSKSATGEGQVGRPALVLHTNSKLHVSHAEDLVATVLPTVLESISLGRS